MSEQQPMTAEEIQWRIKAAGLQYGTASSPEYGPYVEAWGFVPAWTALLTGGQVPALAKLKAVAEEISNQAGWGLKRGRVDYAAMVTTADLLRWHYAITDALAAQQPTEQADAYDRALDAAYAHDPAGQVALAELGMGQAPQRRYTAAEVRQAAVRLMQTSVAAAKLTGQERADLVDAMQQWLSAPAQQAGEALTPAQVDRVRVLLEAAWDDGYSTGRHAPRGAMGAGTIEMAAAAQKDKAVAESLRRLGVEGDA